jgi:transcriptional regulator with PAS, ATPase and Fis domain/predicted hydrocarbon binding protein
MKAEELRLDELVRFGEGLVDLHGRRLILHDTHAVGQFRRDLIEMVGWDDARRILTRSGYFWGQDDAAAMKRLFHWDSVEEWLKAGPKLRQIWGMGIIEPTILRLDEQSGSFSMEFACQNSIEVDQYVAELGTADKPCCWVLMGYASGYASYCLGKSVYFVEQECRAKGDKRCLAMGMDIDSWGEAIVKDLPYFHAADIQGKIEALTNQLREHELELDRRQKQLEHTGRSRIASVEVRSREFQRVVELAERVARFDSSVLITGETGVGKEVVARHIHSQSPRSDAPFVAINCGALPESLLESTLFGHKAGAFTGATKDRPGLFEEAEKGTIFLDEIGDTSPAMQLKLLRVLQEREIMRVGETRPRKVDVRVISATNHNLQQAVRDNTFREDLHYRLRVVEIEVPPLRHRKDDILPLARHFVKKCAANLGLPALRLDATSLDCLLEYSWPGNVRELENAVEHAAVFCQDSVILPKHFPSRILGTIELREERKERDLAKRSLADVEWDHIQRVLAAADGNRAEAAKILGIGEATLYRRLREAQQEQVS